MQIKRIIEYLLSQDDIFKFIILWEILEVFATLFSVLYFLFFYYKTPIFSKLIGNFKRLPIANKFFFLLFTIVSAIPNRVFVNNQISQFGVGFSIFLLLVVSHYFPYVLLLYSFFWFTILESYFFALAYENSVSFKRLIQKRLFHGNTSFARDYFAFFWGNMTAGGISRIRMGLRATALGSFIQYYLIRENEKKYVQAQTRIELDYILSHSRDEPELTSKELAEFKKEVEDHVIGRDTILLSLEKGVRYLGKKMWESWG